MRVLQLSLLLAAMGAVVILLRFGELSSLAGLAAILIGTVLSAPYAPPPNAPGRGWWTMLATGAVITLIAAGLALLVATVGGLLAVVGCVMVAISVALGFPGAADR